MKAFNGNTTLRFTLPVMLESILNTIIGLVFSYLVGGLSGSALTTIGQGNQIINLICAAATMLVTGSSILCSRLLGAGDNLEASRVVEQTMLLTVSSSLVITALCLIFTGPLMRVLMPGAEPAVLSEGISFFRVLILSLPFAMLNNAITSILRATGDGKSPLSITGFVCLFQILFAYLFMRVIPLGVVGTGLSYLGCRALGTVFAFLVLSRNHDYFLNFRGMLKPKFDIFKRILRVGVPTSVESIFVQTGYLVANSMVIGLGTFEAAVFNVANTLYSFSSLPQGISATIAMTLIGQLIGAKEYKRARRTGWNIWLIGMGASLFLSLILLFGGQYFTPIYTSDPQVQAHAAMAMLPLFFLCIPATSLNTLDPQLRVGGDVKYVMYVTIFAVWLIRLPLTYLFCYVWNMGANGVFWANTISLAFRMLFNMVRFIKGKYLYMRV